MRRSRARARVHSLIRRSARDGKNLGRTRARAHKHALNRRRRRRLRCCCSANGGIDDSDRGVCDRGDDGGGERAGCGKNLARNSCEPAMTFVCLRMRARPFFCYLAR